MKNLKDLKTLVRTKKRIYLATAIIALSFIFTIFSYGLIDNVGCGNENVLNNHSDDKGFNSKNNLDTLKNSIVEEGNAPVLPNLKVISFGGFDDGFDERLLNKEGDTTIPFIVIFGGKWLNPSNQNEIVKKLIKNGVFVAHHMRAIKNWSKYEDCSEIEKICCFDNSDGITQDEIDKLYSKEIIQKCANYNLANWEVALNKTFDGLFPNGVPAIAIDEIPMGYNNYPNPTTDIDDLIATFNLKIELETLKLAKTKYPNKLFFVWSGGNKDTKVFNSLIYADFILFETYLKEGEYPNWILSQVNDIKKICNNGTSCEGITNKLLLTVFVSQTEDSANDIDPSIDMCKYIEEELHFIKNNPGMGILDGISFYTLNRTNPVTIPCIHKLAKHYYLDNKKDYLLGGNYNLDYIKNPSFESGNNNWNLQAGLQGVVSVSSLADVASYLVNPPNVYNPRIPHGSSVLYLKRGKTKNVVMQDLTLPTGVFDIDVYSKKINGLYNQPSAIDIQIHSNNESLITYKESQLVSTSPGSHDDKYHLWRRERIEFTVVDGNNPVKLLITDTQAINGEEIIIDFVELTKIETNVNLTSNLTLPKLTNLIEVDINQIGNGDFLNKLSNWNQWTNGISPKKGQKPNKAKISVVDLKQASKNFAIMIETKGNLSQGAIFKGNGNEIPATPGEHFTLKAKVKTTTVEKTRLVVRYFNKDMAWLGGISDPTNGSNIASNQEWMEYSLDVVVPKGATYIVPMLLAEYGNGIALFDDVKLIRYKK